MKLEEYKKLEDKKEFFKFGDSQYDTCTDDIFKKIQEFEKLGESFIYRGITEAKYKLYNSAQRLYINQELHRQVHPDSIAVHYKEFIENLIENCKSWNNGVVKNLLKSSGIDENNAIAYLSYMQHFGVPSPFLDYTYNPYIALFFAIDSVVYLPSDNEIDNYFSVYYTYTKSTIFETFKYVFDNNLKKEDISYKSMDLNNMSIILPDEELYQIINSVNIINQEGLFFYNNHPWYPLEKTYKDHTTFLIKEKGRKTFDDLLAHETFSGCLNIHKSLVPVIREKLNQMGINKNFVYPSMNDFRFSVTNTGILESIKRN